MKNEIKILAHGGQIARANEALLPEGEQLAADLADTKLLHALSLELAEQEDSQALYEKIVDAAVAIMRSEYSSMQMLYPERGSGGELRLLAFRGFNPEAAEFWEWVRADSESTCGMALRTGKRSVASDVEQCGFMAGTQDLETYLQTGIRAVQTTPLVSRGGRLVGMISTHWRRPHEPSERDWRLFDLLARQAADLIERASARQALLESERRLQSELTDLQLLHRISIEMSHPGEPQALYEKIVDAAVAIMGSQFASMQMFHPGRGKAGELRLLACHGFSREAAELWEWVSSDTESTCASVLRGSRRAIVPDIRECDFMAGTQGLAAYLQAGILSAQSTPLYSRVGKLVGMISTHWSAPHQPSERDWRLFDILARQAADLIERASAEQELKQAARRKDEFLAILSHELRNPLAPIRAAVDLLASNDLEVRAQARAILLRQVAHATRLVDDLLDLSRITQGSLALQTRWVELREVLEAAVETSRPNLSGGGHELQITLPAEPVRVLADPVRFGQVVANVLNNAAKYTPRGGRIHLAARVEAYGAVISVVDNGIGISAEALPHIFDGFARAEASGRTDGGLGIGLSLARRLIELHGGWIEARSEGTGKGAAFSVFLPRFAAPAAQPEEQSPAAALSAQRRRVLVVDDNVDAAITLRMLLEQMGHEVSVAHDGRAALETANRKPPEIVLLDLGLPKIDGYGVAERLRRDLRFERTRLVAVTGYGQSADRDRSRQAGFDEHLLKPISPEALKTLMDR